MSEIPEPKAIPLRQAVIRYQFPRPDDPPEMTAAELVQRYCDTAVGLDVPFRFRFVPQASAFHVVNEAELEEALAAAKVGPDIEYDPDVESISLLASFYIGDDFPTMSDFSTEGPLFDAVRAKMQNLHTLLARSLHAPWNAERMIVSGRAGTPLAERTKIPPDVFGQFAVLDWEKGVVTAGEISIYAVIVEEKEKACHVQPREAGRPPTAIDGKTKSADFARFWLEQTEFGETKPQNIPWKVIRSKYLLWAKLSPDATIDDDTMRKGIELANARRRRGNSGASAS